MEITFLGATGTVTGSRYLVTGGGSRILVDCGLFQGLKQLRLRNREPFPVDPASIDAVVLTHAHLDHTGYVPLLIRNGFRGPVYATPATRDLCSILLPDSGHLQEEEAREANRYGYSKHHPALPLYTREDAEASLPSFRDLPIGESLDLGGLSVTLHEAGHLLGSAMVELRDLRSSVVFSGDLGRPSDPLLPPPARIRQADFLVVESTYGNRKHSPVDPLDELAEVIQRTAERGGSVLIPSFAVGRAQTLLYLIHQLKRSGRIAWLPVYLDSPMASSATEIFRRHPEAHRLSTEECGAAFRAAVPVESVADSREVDAMLYPRIVISASGMATGGRVLHHLKAMASDPRNTILFAGFQAAGTRGAAMVAGAESVKIHGSYVPIRAEVRSLDNLSAHADADEVLGWLGGFECPPRETFVTHGEPGAADALRHRIEEGLGWSCRVPEYRERVLLDRRRARPETRRTTASAA
jgi:metallo-beta-lactamase family protein